MRQSILVGFATVLQAIFLFLQVFLFFSLLFVPCWSLSSGFSLCFYSNYITHMRVFLESLSVLVFQSVQQGKKLKSIYSRTQWKHTIKHIWKRFVSFFFSPFNCVYNVNQPVTVVKYTWIHIQLRGKMVHGYYLLIRTRLLTRLLFSCAFGVLASGFVCVFDVEEHIIYIYICSMLLLLTLLEYRPVPFCGNSNTWLIEENRVFSLNKSL